MTYRTVINATELKDLARKSDVVIFDCRFSLNDVERGRNAWRKAHIPNAFYAHLDENLSGPVEKGRTGRHPLPNVDIFGKWLGDHGVGENVQVVVYDDMGGAIAARLWWMVRWLGHDAVAVLNGGWQAWNSEGFEVSDQEPEPTPKIFKPKPRADMVVSMEEVMNKRNNPDYLVLDARGHDRYRGENETIDPVAGHIPGAISAHFALNLDSAGYFLSPEELNQRFQPMQEEASSRHTIVYCGSGVTAAHNILAMAHAGLGDALLYPGSWSEWITDPSNPVATGKHVFGNQ